MQDTFCATGAPSELHVLGSRVRALLDAAAGRDTRHDCSICVERKLWLHTGYFPAREMVTVSAVERGGNGWFQCARGDDADEAMHEFETRCLPELLLSGALRAVSRAGA